MSNADSPKPATNPPLILIDVRPPSGSVFDRILHILWGMKRHG